MLHGLLGPSGCSLAWMMRVSQGWRTAVLAPAGSSSCFASAGGLGDHKLVQVVHGDHSWKSPGAHLLALHFWFLYVPYLSVAGWGGLISLP